MALSRARFLRKYPAPPPTPDGMCWRRNADGETVLIAASVATQEAIRKLGNYDLYPREVRDQIKETGRRVR